MRNNSKVWTVHYNTKISLNINISLLDKYRINLTLTIVIILMSNKEANLRISKVESIRKWDPGRVNQVQEKCLLKNIINFIEFHTLPLLCIVPMLTLTIRKMSICQIAVIFRSSTPWEIIYLTSFKVSWGTNQKLREEGQCKRVWPEIEWNIDNF